MRYRREIDGLRAVAVIPVILFHAGFTIFSGGYVGVDVFFVISGYLITSIIITELEHGKFSILRFYERRARRILPALFFVMLCCIPFAWMWMVPSQFKEFSQSLVAVSVFVSNILFWRESGYFAAASEEKPLLHTWSLAVEEQYYVLFPIFLILLWRFGRNPVFYSIIVISIISLLLSEWGWRNQPTANFYLAPTRAWELLAGSICAFLQSGKTQKSNNAFSAFGLALIVFAIFIYDESTPFPSIYALAPVVGTALIIMYGVRGTWVAQLLSLKGFVGIGLISYSAYLWHQPLFAFARIRSLYAPEQWIMLVLAVASLVLAYFSWRFVEHPFRKQTVPALRSQVVIFRVASVAAATFIAFGAYGHSKDGLPTRFPSIPASLFNVIGEVPDDSNCRILNVYSTPKITNCLKSIKTEKVILIGDSHAAAISRMLSAELAHNGRSLITFTKYGCFPILSTSRAPLNVHTDCLEFKHNVYDFIEKNPGVPVIIFTRWASYMDGSWFDNGEGGVETWATSFKYKNFTLDKDGNIDEKHELLQTISEQLIKLSENNQTIVLTQFPEAGWNVANRLLKSFIFGDKTDEISTSKVVYDARNSSTNNMLNSINSIQLHVVNTQNLFCDTFIIKRCINYFDNKIYYLDDDHPSAIAATLIAKAIVNELNSLK